MIYVTGDTHGTHDFAKLLDNKYKKLITTALYDNNRIIYFDQNGDVEVILEGGTYYNIDGIIQKKTKGSL